MVDIRIATTKSDFLQVRALVVALVDWLRELFAEDTTPIDEYFVAIQPELDNLPGVYAPPRGRLLLARHHGQPVGTVAMRDIGDGTCEMKRMYVDTTMHRQGIGRDLAMALVNEARAAGYARMRLDTSRRQAAAIALYRGMGFREIAPYYDVSDLLRQTMHYMELPLIGDSVVDAR